MRIPSIILFLITTLCMTSFAQSDHAAPPERLTAPTYYIAVEALCHSTDELEFRGVSNLPIGALISASVRNFNEDAWKDYSDDVFSAVGEDGSFHGKITPKSGMEFRGNLILVGDFKTYSPKQPDKVLRIVGQKGRNMGDMLKNPQMFQVSGWYYGLEAIARASCHRSGEK